METKELKRLSELLRKKKECLLSVLKMTEERNFKVREEDVERIYNFFNKRELLFENCKNLDKKIKEYIILDIDKENSFYDEIEKTKEETRDIINRIIELDKKNQKIMTELLNYIKNNIRNIKQTKQVRRSYDEFFTGESYGRFDSKR